MTTSTRILRLMSPGRGKTLDRWGRRRVGTAAAVTFTGLLAGRRSRRLIVLVVKLDWLLRIKFVLRRLRSETSIVVSKISRLGCCVARMLARACRVRQTRVADVCVPGNDLGDGAMGIATSLKFDKSITKCILAL